MHSAMNKIFAFTVRHYPLSTVAPLLLPTILNVQVFTLTNSHQYQRWIINTVNEIFSVRQPCGYVKALRRIREWLCPNLQSLKSWRIFTPWRSCLPRFHWILSPRKLQGLNQHSGFCSGFYMFYSLPKSNRSDCSIRPHPPHPPLPPSRQICNRFIPYLFFHTESCSLLVVTITLLLLNLQAHSVIFHVIARTVCFYWPSFVD